MKGDSQIDFYYFGKIGWVYVEIRGYFLLLNYFSFYKLL